MIFRYDKAWWAQLTEQERRTLRGENAIHLLVVMLPVLATATCCVLLGWARLLAQATGV